MQGEGVVAALSDWEAELSVCDFEEGVESFYFLKRGTKLKKMGTSILKLNMRFPISL